MTKWRWFLKIRTEHPNIIISGILSIADTDSTYSMRASLIEVVILFKVTFCILEHRHLAGRILPIYQILYHLRKQQGIEKCRVVAGGYRM